MPSERRSPAGEFLGYWFSPREHTAVPPVSVWGKVSTRTGHCRADARGSASRSRLGRAKPWVCAQGDVRNSVGRTPSR
jgi:hypothetical protein